MTADALHHQPLMPDLLIDGLNRYNDEPCLFLGDKVATYKDVRESASQMVQALQSKGLGVGSRIAIISTNRPEVLSNIAAMQLNGCIGTPLHPLGSVDDHAYVLEAAEIETLIFDTSVFTELAEALKQRVPTLKNLLGFGPSEVGDDYLALAASFEPKPLVAPDVSPDDIASVNFTGGTTGKPKGVMSTYSVTSYMTQIQMAEWEFPEELRMLMATPLSHAAAAFFVPVLQKGGAFYVMQGFSPDEFFDMVEQHNITCTMLVPVMLYFLLDSPRSATANMSSMETIFYGASAMNPTRLVEGINKWGQIFYQFFGQSECPMVISNMTRKEHDLSKPERSRRQRGATRRAWRNLYSRSSDYERLQGYARTNCRGVCRRMASHRGCRQVGRRWLSLYRRSHQGHDRYRRFQCIPTRSRGCPRYTRSSRAGCRHRRP
jgi:fatty-acyl-CoA synthase